MLRWASAIAPIGAVAAAAIGSPPNFNSRAGGTSRCIRWMLGFVAAACHGAAALRSRSPPVERGNYLVNTIMTCANCHSPKGPPAAVRRQGLFRRAALRRAAVRRDGANITPDKETGIGNWTDDQIKTLMLTGKRPNGVQVAEIMPTAFYHDPHAGRPRRHRRLSAQSCRRSRTRCADPVYKIALPHHVFPGAEKPYHARPT